MRLVSASQDCAVTKALPIVLVLASWIGLLLPPYKTSVARAQGGSPAFDLQWNAPAACMSPNAARAEIDALIRIDRIDSGARARIRVLIEGTQQAGYSASIDIERGASSGERTLRGTRCAEVAEASILVIAMVIDPEGVAARAPVSAPSGSSTTAEPSSPSPNTTSSPTAAQPARPDQPAREPVAESDVEPTEDEEPAEAEDATDDEPPEEEEDEPEGPSDPRKAGRVVLGVRALGDAGSLPSLTLGGGLIAGLHWQRARIELQALAYLPQIEERGPTPGSTTEVRLLAGAISGCFNLIGTRDDPRALGGCAAIEAGLSSAEPRRISDGQDQAGLWLAGFLGLDLRQQLVGPVHLRLLGELGAPILRPRYEIDPFGTVFRASPVLGRFGISLFVLFP